MQTRNLYIAKPKTKPLATEDKAQAEKPRITTDDAGIEAPDAATIERFERVVKRYEDLVAAEEARQAELKVAKEIEEKAAARPTKKTAMPSGLGGIISQYNDKKTSASRMKSTSVKNP